MDDGYIIYTYMYYTNVVLKQHLHCEVCCWFSGKKSLFPCATHKNNIFWFIPRWQPPLIASTSLVNPPLKSHGTTVVNGHGLFCESASRADFFSFKKQVMEHGHL